MSANSVRNVNTAMLLQSTESNFLADEKGPHHLAKLLFSLHSILLHLFLQIARIIIPGLARRQTFSVSSPEVGFWRSVLPAVGGYRSSHPKIEKTRLVSMKTYALKKTLVLP